MITSLGVDASGGCMSVVSSIWLMHVSVSHILNEVVNSCRCRRKEEQPASQIKTSGKVNLPSRERSGRSYNPSWAALSNLRVGSAKESTALRALEDVSRRQGGRFDTRDVLPVMMDADKIAKTHSFSTPVW